MFSYVLFQKKCLQTVPDADHIKELLSLDPRLKKEYIEVFLKLLKEKLGDNKQLAEVCQAHHRLWCHGSP